MPKYLIQGSYTGEGLKGLLNFQAGQIHVVLLLSLTLKVGTWTVRLSQLNC